MMLEVANALAGKWTRQGPDADIVVADDMTRLTLDTISLACFGYRFDSFQSAQLHPFLEAMVGVLSEAMGKLTRLPIQDRFMREHHRRYAEDVARMHALVDEVIRARRQTGDDGASDLLGLMLNARDPVGLQQGIVGISRVGVIVGQSFQLNDFFGGVATQTFDDAFLIHGIDKS